MATERAGKTKETADERKVRLRAAVDDAGYTPARKDADGLVALYDEDDDALAKKVDVALSRLGEAAVAPAVDAFAGGSPRLRARVVRLMGRLEVEASRRVDFLVTCLDDHDPRTRRIAVVALGKAGAGSAKAEKALVDLAAVATKDGGATGPDASALRRAIAEALGKIGSLDAVATVGALVAGDARVEKRAALMLKRTHSRSGASAIRDDVAIPGTVEIVFHARGGLEKDVADELGGRGEIRGRGLVALPFQGKLSELFDVRTATHFAIALPPSPRPADPSPRALSETVAALLAEEATQTLLRALTDGAVRYRLDFAGKGHRRALVWDTAVLVSERAPLLENDPTSATWEVVVYERADKVFVELVPKSLVDPRFAYREGDVPAASHPTIAAALARMGGVRAEDVVWDPFVGSGTELVERANLGAYVGLVGTDLDTRAIAIAEKNLARAGIRGATVLPGDATTFDPGPVSLVITNPPLGKRVRFTSGPAEFLDRFLGNVARVLVPNGRMAWVSPNAKTSDPIAARHGLVVDREHDVDMGGFTLSMQRLVKKKPKASR
ncbi:MAG: methyltransferase [Polyangiaceae bacterium]